MKYRRNGNGKGVAELRVLLKRVVIARIQKNKKKRRRVVGLVLVETMIGSHSWFAHKSRSHVCTLLSGLATTTLSRKQNFYAIKWIFFFPLQTPFQLFGNVWMRHETGDLIGVECVRWNFHSKQHCFVKDCRFLFLSLMEIAVEISRKQMEYLTRILFRWEGFFSNYVQSSKFLNKKFDRIIF